MHINKITIGDVGRWYQGEDGEVLLVKKVYGAMIYVQTPKGNVYYPIHDIVRRITEEEAHRIMAEDGFGKPEVGIKPRRMSKCAKRVIAITPKGDERVFESISSAAAEMGISQVSISESCRGVRKTAGGHDWRFES